MPTRMKFRERRIKRAEFAAELATEREKRGDAGQLARLEANGHGHCREADKLRKKLGKVGPIAGDLEEQVQHTDALNAHLEGLVK